MFSPTELSCPSLGTAWTSWGMFPLTLWVILFVGVELPLSFSLGSCRIHVDARGLEMGLEMGLEI